MVVMALVLLALGYVIGMVFFGTEGGLFGVLIASGVWVFLTIMSFAGGDKVFLLASKAKPVTKEVNPQLYNIVEEMTIAAGLSKMPKIYIINDPAPNAFATGRKPENASIAVTAGLLGKLNRDEMQGVVAHEMSHILHRDIMFVTIAGIMLGSIVILSNLFFRWVIYGSLGGSRRHSSGSGKGNAQTAQAMMIIAIVAIIAAILAPILAHILYFALSRRREYLADAGGARLTRYPEGLASALEKIANDPSPQLASANKVTATMYIANPLKKKKKKKLSDLSSTHPPISERIRILRNMTHGASFEDYSVAYRNATGRKKAFLPVAAFNKEEVALQKKKAQAERELKQAEQQHKIGDIMRAVNGFVFLTCTCSMKMKVPSNFKEDRIQCPRCNRVLDVPKTNNTA